MNLYKITSSQGRSKRLQRGDGVLNSCWMQKTRLIVQKVENGGGETDGRGGTGDYGGAFSAADGWLAGGMQCGKNPHW